MLPRSIHDNCMTKVQFLSVAAITAPAHMSLEQFQVAPHQLPQPNAYFRPTISGVFPSLRSRNVKNEKWGKPGWRASTAVAQSYSDLFICSRNAAPVVHKQKQREFQNTDAGKPQVKRLI